jgi:hypothetical protein
LSVFSTTTAKLDSFKIYHCDTVSNDTNVIVTIKDTIYNVGNAFMGKVWVTALYSSPIGESLASNVINVGPLPIGIKSISISAKKTIVYDIKQQAIVLKNIDNPISIRVIDSSGKVLKILKNRGIIDISELSSGVYIIEVINNNSDTIRQKIIK